MAGVIIRDAVRADMPAVRDLYNALIPTTTVAWTDTPETLRQRRAWFRRQRRRGRPVLVAEHDGAVVGFATYEDFRGAGKWPGYRHTVEQTVHVAEAHWGSGVGRALFDALLTRAGDDGVHVIVAAIDGDNDASIRFHERLGFAVTARMPELGRKFDRWLDLVLMQRTVDGPIDGADGGVGA
jgi:L-amino acid N-acyltransferase YncA